MEWCCGIFKRLNTLLLNPNNQHALDDPDHFLDNQSRQLRFAPILIGIHWNNDLLPSGTLIDITRIRTHQYLKTVASFFALVIAT
jgi:hypothetical protein